MTSLQQSHSPATLQFAARGKTFDVAPALARDWHGDGAFVTAWFNAMSLLFPLGEKFFIDSVSHFSSDIDDPQLSEEISAFRAQEANHRAQHQRYNESLCKQRGYDLDRFETNIRKRMAWAYRELSPRRRLAGTVANEHLTAIMANDLLTTTDVMAKTDAEIAAMWHWHALEETEHKAVAFDVYVAVGGNVSERRQALLVNTFFFLKDTFRNVAIMLKADGKLWSAREWYRGFRFLLLSPGILRRCFVPWLAFFRRDYHPWQVENLNVVQRWAESMDDASGDFRG